MKECIARQWTPTIVSELAKIEHFSSLHLPKMCCHSRRFTASKLETIPHGLSKFNWRHHTMQFAIYDLLYWIYILPTDRIEREFFFASTLFNLNILVRMFTWNDSCATVAINDRKLTDAQRFSVLANSTQHENIYSDRRWYEIEMCSVNNDYIHTRKQREPWVVTHSTLYGTRTWWTTQTVREWTEIASYEAESCAESMNDMCTVHWVLWVSYRIIHIIIVMCTIRTYVNWECLCVRETVRENVKYNFTW